MSLQGYFRDIAGKQECSVLLSPAEVCEVAPNCSRRNKTRLPLLFAFFSLLFLLAVPVFSWAQGDTVVVASKTYAGSLKAYAQVEPLGNLPLVANAEGVVSGLKVMPGDIVQANKILATLAGPQVRARRVQAKAEVSSTKAALRLALHTLRIKTTLYGEHLVTLLEVHQAQAQVAVARARLAAALAQETQTEAAGFIRAPVEASVESIHVANGAHVLTGEVIMELQPSGKLWLIATFYGNQIRKIHPGMLATFQPADGSDPIPVQVHGLIPSELADGGVKVGFVPLKSPLWLNGESGTLKLSLPAKTWPAVPTQALILDQGHWWVLVSGKNGIHPVSIEPGPVAGNLTLIRQGLKVGDVVVTTDAYLRFHKELGSTYQPPD